MLEYTVAEAPELAQLLMAAHSPIHNLHVEKALIRFLGNGDAFSVACPLEKASQHIDAGKCSNFVYDKKTGLVFMDCQPGWHQMLMFHLEGLHQTDMSQDFDSWFDALLAGNSSTDKMADAFVERGHGLLLSSVSKMKVTVGAAFLWSEAERAAFRHYAHDLI